jgi:hypothetical protein
MPSSSGAEECRNKNLQPLNMEDIIVLQMVGTTTPMAVPIPECMNPHGCYFIRWILSLHVCVVAVKAYYPCHVHLATCISAAATSSISMKSDAGDFCENL